MRLGIYLLVMAIFICAVSQESRTSPPFFQKIIIIHVNDKSEIHIDRIPMYTETLAKELQHRIWRSYVTSGKMVRLLKLEMEGSVPDQLQKDIYNAIREAQEKTLTVLSLHKYKKRFEDIGGSKQNKIRKQFPVLFQTVFIDP